MTTDRVAKVGQMLKTLPARMIVSMFAVTITFGALLVASLLYLTAQTYKDQFIDGVRHRAFELSKAIGTEETQARVKQILSDALFSHDLLYVEYVSLAEPTRNSVLLNSPEAKAAQFTEDYFFDDHDDGVYYVSVAVAGANEKTVGELRLGFDEEIVQAQLHHIQQRGLVFALVYLWAVLLISASLALRMTKPLRLLQEGAREIASGNTRHELNVSTSLVEISGLAADLEHMRKELLSRGDKLAASEARYAAIVQYAADPIITIDRDARIENFNLAAEVLFGYQATELIGSPFQALLGNSEGFPALSDPDWSTKFKDSNFIGRHKNGTTFPLSLAPNSFESTDLTCVTLVARDISERVAFEQEMTGLAYYDTLTQLPNRRLFESRLAEALQQAHSCRKLVAVFFIDLDGFKAVNDTYGHQFGDQILVASADRLKALLRQSDTIARLGGDEFTVVLSDLVDAADSHRIAEKVIVAFSQPFEIDGRSVSLSTSIGVAIYPLHGSEPLEILEHADAAMYHAKKKGKNCYRFYTAEMANTSAERTQQNPPIQFIA